MRCLLRALILFMGVTASHILSATTPDNPAYEIQPQHWNSAHAITLNAVGSEISGAFGNGGGVSFGLSADGKLTAAAPAGAPSPVHVTAGTSEGDIGTIAFIDSNGLAFGLNGSTITGSYTQSTHAHPYRASTDAVGLNTALTANGVAWTVNSSGISLNIPAFLTTQTVQTQASGAIPRSGFTTTTVAGAVVAGTHNTDGLLLAVPAYLTTAAASNHSHGNPTLALTNLSGTTASNSAGLTLSLSAAAPGAAAEANAVHLLGANTAGNTTATGSTIGWSGVNVTLSGTNASQIVVSGPAQSNLTVSGFLSLSTDGSTMTIGAGPLTFYAVSNTTQATSGTIDGRSLSVQGRGGVSVGVSNGSLVISGGAGGGVAAANSQTTYTSGTFSLREAGGAITIQSTTGQRFDFSVPATSSLVAGANITVSTDGSTISIIGGAGGAGFSAGLSTGGNTAGDTGVTATRLVLVGGNNITLSQATGANGGTITVSAFNQSVQTQASGAIPRSGFTTTTIAGAVVAGTNNTDGLLLAVPAYLTTAAASNHSHGNPTLALTNLTGTTASASNGFTLSLSAAAPGAAAEANAVHLLGANTAGNTTASGSTIGWSGINVTLSGKNDSQVVISAAAQTEQTQNLFAAIVSGANGNLTQTSGTLSFKAGDNITLSTGANVFSIHGVAAQTVQTQASGAIPRSGFTTTTVAGAVIAGTNNTDGLLLAVPAYLTTAAASNHSHGNPTLALTNLTGTTASASNGFTLSLSAAAPGAAAESNWVHALGANTAGNTTASGSTIGLSGINLTISGANDSVMKLSVPATSSLHATGAVSISTNGSTISIGVPNPGTVSFIEIADGGRLTTCAVWNNGTYSRRPIFVPFQAENVLQSCGTIRLFASRSSGTVLVATLFAGIYSRANSTSMNLISSTSMNISLSTSAQYSGIRVYDITGLSGLSLSEGGYILGIMASMANTNSLPLHLMGGDGQPIAGFVQSGTDQTAASDSRSHLLPFWGVFNATTAAMPAAVAMSSISGGNSVNSPDLYAIIKAI